MDTRSYQAIAYVHLDCTQFPLKVLAFSYCYASVSKTVSFKFGLGYNRLVPLLIDSFRPQQLEVIRGSRIYFAKNPVNQSSRNISQHVLT